MYSVHATNQSEWREQARLLLANRIHPQNVQWNDQSPQQSLFAEGPVLDRAQPVPTVPKEFVSLAQTVAHHRYPERWNLLYHMLWRLKYEERHLLRITTDPLTHALYDMAHAVKRDAHKAKAFVRFRQLQTDEGEQYIAWHRPDHYILPVVAPFFQRRFSAMRWSILTPDQSVMWDGEQLHYGPGVPASTVADDALEDLWRTYYCSIFNPARISVSAMKREMPVRHWATLPEAVAIHQLLSQAPGRVARMVAHQEGTLQSAADFLPAERDLDSLQQAAQHCQGCPLHACASRVVFGEGPSHARLMLVGEQPGDEEDKTGRPFVGPAGQVLDRALQEVGLSRDQLYITNAVKHFKYQLKEGMRYHRTPSLKDITGCKPWLMAEMAAVRPSHIVTLGVSAARALVHPNFTLKEGRGQWVNTQEAPLLPTYHPSAILRARPQDQASLYSLLVSDLAQAARHVSA